MEGALWRDSSSGSRGGGSRLCKQDVYGKIESRFLRACACLGPPVQQQISTSISHSHAQLNIIRIALFCIASIWFFGIYQACDATQELRILVHA